MKNLFFGVLLVLFSRSVFAACAKSSSVDTWTLYAEINGQKSAVGKGSLVVLPSGAID